MAAGDPLLPEQAKIYICPSGVAASSTYEFQGYITNFSQSGGESEFENRPVFGGGNIALTKTRTEIEVSFDIIFSYGSVDAKWDSMVLSSTLLSSAAVPTKDIYVQWTDGTLFYTRAYRAAKAVTFTPESASDDLKSGSISFKLSATNASGAANHKVTSTAASSVTW